MGLFVFGVVLTLIGAAGLVGGVRARGRVAVEGGRHRPPTVPAPEVQGGEDDGGEATDTPTPAPPAAPATGKRPKPKSARPPRPAVPQPPALPAGVLAATLLGAGAVLLGTGVLCVALSTLYTQDVGEAVVVRSPGGTVVGVDATPGFSAKAPWNSLVRFDIRNQVITMAGEGSSDGPAITAQTSDNATASIDLTVRYSIQATRVGEIYAGYMSQESLRERALDVDVRSIVRDIPIEFAAGELRQSRGKVTLAIADELSRAWEKLGVTVDSVDLRDIRYPAEIEQSLAAVQTARSKVEQARADLETAKINAEKIKTEAQAQSDADQIIRCGASSMQVKEVVGGKETMAVKVIPVPNGQCQNRLNEQVLTRQYIDMLREAADKGNTIYVVPQGAQNLIQLQAPSAAKPQ